MCDRRSSSKDRNLCLMSSLNLKLFLIAPIAPFSKWIATHPKAYVCRSENSRGVYTANRSYSGKKTLKRSQHIWDCRRLQSGPERVRLAFRGRYTFTEPRGFPVPPPSGVILLLGFTIWLIPHKTQSKQGFLRQSVFLCGGSTETFWFVLKPLKRPISDGLTARGHAAALRPIHSWRQLLSHKFSQSNHQ